MANAAGRFNGPWRPGADAYNADPGSLLRADNMTRDEDGSLSLRLGSRLVFPSMGGPVTALGSVILNSVERIAAAVDEQLYVDGEAVVDGILSDSDTAFGASRGHLLVISGDNKYKYDGDTLRNWGIVAPADAPTVSVTDVATKTVANFSLASAEFTASEGTKSNVTGVDGVANSATGLTPAVGTGRGIMSYVFAATTNLLDIQGNKGGDFDVFSFWVDDPQPEKFTYMDIDIGISSGSDPYATDYYHYRVGSILEPVQVQLTQAEVSRAADAQAAAASEPSDTPTPPEDEQDTTRADHMEDRRDNNRDDRKRSNT